MWTCIKTKSWHTVRWSSRNVLVSLWRANWCEHLIKRAFTFVTLNTKPDDKCDTVGGVLGNVSQWQENCIYCVCVFHFHPFNENLGWIILIFSFRSTTTVESVAINVNFLISLRDHLIKYSRQINSFVLEIHKYHSFL